MRDRVVVSASAVTGAVLSRMSVSHGLLGEDHIRATPRMVLLDNDSVARVGSLPRGSNVSQPAVLLKRREEKKKKKVSRKRRCPSCGSVRVLLACSFQSGRLRPSLSGRRKMASVKKSGEVETEEVNGGHSPGRAPAETTCHMILGQSLFTILP